MNTAERLKIQRPKNKTWETLGEIVSEIDRRSEQDGEGVDEIFTSITAMQMEDFLTNLAIPQIKALYEAAGENDQMDVRMILIASWVGGFGHGANHANGIDITEIPDTHEGRVDEMELRMYGGVNIESVDYVADQRIMRIMNETAIDSTANLTVSTLVAYIDGFSCGYKYISDRETL